MLKAATGKAIAKSTGLGMIILQSGVNSVNSAMQTRSAIAQSNAAYTNKINSTALTPISASGTVPTDLFDNYTNNKLIRFEYTLKADDLSNIWKSFRLTGYSHPVKEVPDFNSRIYSNFVQCNAVFNNDSTEIYKVFLDDIRNRFAAGVTVKHCFNGNYDLKDQFENYETIVFGGND